MGIKNFNTRNIDIVFIILVGMAYLIGILSTSHLLPSNNDFLPNLQASFFVAMGLAIWFLFSKVKGLSVSSLTWLYLMLLVAIQPLISKISYPDGLIFSVGSLFLVACVGVVINNLQYKKAMVTISVALLLLGSLLTLATQIIQVLDWQSFFGRWITSVEQDGRPFGNVGQPNQAAYILSMGMAGLLYFTHKVKTFPDRKQQLWAYFVLVVGFLGLSLGLGLTSSRGGFILSICAVLGYAIFFQNTLKVRITFVAIFSVVFLCGYNLGASLLQTQVNYATAVERFTNDTFSLRYYQLQEAWLIFLQNPIFGAGWRNFAQTGVEVAEQLPWFSYSNHSHFFISNIASELGILGLMALIPLAIIIVKNFKFNLPDEKAIAMVIVGLTLLYSCSEYPLWFFRFLVIFALFLAVLDDSKFSLSLDYKFVIGLVNVFIVVAVGFYYFIYYQYQYATYVLTSKEFSEIQKIEIYENLPSTFGFSQYKELMLFYLMQPSEEQIEEKIELGNRVISIYPSREYIIKQADLLAVDKQTQNALTLYKAACVFDFAVECTGLAEYLQELQVLQPQKFTTINTQFTAWRQANPDKTGLTREREQAKQYQKQESALVTP